jgi:dTDP-4-amino-4,6-dideoxygalactose transaminase
MDPAFSRPLHVGAPNVPARARFLDLVGEALDANWLTNDGRLVRQLEEMIADRLGVRECIVTCNGTAALEIAARCVGLSGEVLVPSFTFAATATALEWIGLTPVFCDVDRRTYCIDPADAERRITPRTSGLIGVHLFGRPCDTQALADLAQRRGLTLLYDAAHAFGCTSGGRPIGSFGRCEVFSFHATKFFNTIEGGAVTTDDPDLAHCLRLARNFGYEDGVVRSLGINAKMHEVSAAMGIANLELLDEILERNRRNHELYAQALAGAPGVEFMTFAEGESCNRQYVVIEVTAEAACTRDELLEHLSRENVLARSYFSPGCHRLQPFVGRRLTGGGLPVTDELSERLLSLPTGLQARDADVLAVAALVRAAVSGGVGVGAGGPRAG